MENHFAGHGLLIDGIVFLSPREALAFLEADAILVDLRTEETRNGRRFDVEQVIDLPHPQFVDEFDTLPRDKPLILVDCVGLRSKECVKILLQRGYGSVASLNGGMVEWLGQGLPTIVDRGEELVGQCVCQLRPSKFFRGKPGG